MIELFFALILFCVVAAIARDISWKHAVAFVAVVAICAAIL